MTRRYADWRGWFKTQPTDPAEEPLPLSEVKIISAWDLTPTTWRQLTEQERSHKRFNVTKAPRYVG